MNKIEIIQKLAVEREENDITVLQMAKKMVIHPSIAKKYHDETIKLEKTGKSNIVQLSDYKMALCSLLAKKNGKLSEEQLRLLQEEPTAKVVQMYVNDKMRG